MLLVKKTLCLYKFNTLYGTHAFPKMPFRFSEVLKVFFFMKFDLLKDCTLSPRAPRCFGMSQTHEQKA